MLATQLTPTTLPSLPTQTRRQVRETTPSDATPEQVRNMLLEIAFNLHATRVVKKMKRPAAPKKTVEAV